MRRTIKLKERLVEAGYSGSLNWALYTFLKDQGYSGQLNEMLMEYFDSLEYTGTYPEMWKMWEDDYFTFYPDNMITNGTFTTDTVWAYNNPPWLISGGVLNAIGGANNSCQQTVIFENGVIYKTSLTANASGLIKIGHGRNNAGMEDADLVPGRNHFRMFGATNNSNYSLRWATINSTYIGTIDDVVVRKLGVPF